MPTVDDFELLSDRLLALDLGHLEVMWSTS